MTRAHKRDVDKEGAARSVLGANRPPDLGFDAKALVASAMERAFQGPEKEGAREAGRDAPPGAERQSNLTGHPSRADPAKEAVEWALAHLSERDAVFARTDLLAAALAYCPGSASIVSHRAGRRGPHARRAGVHDAPALKGGGDGMTTDSGRGRECETIALIRAWLRTVARRPCASWMVSAHLHKGPLTAGTEGRRGQTHSLGI